MIDQVRILMGILERMEGLYLRALALLDQERGSLVRLDFDTLHGEMREKDELLALLRRLDRDRLRVQDTFAQVWGRSVTEVSLRDIAQALIEEGGDSKEAGARLMDFRERIEVVIGRLKERIQSNGRFIEKSVHNLRAVAETMGAQVPGRASKSNKKLSKTYGPQKQMREQVQPTGGILEKIL
jgi:flagellar biosynthesis/type III secretory pathway chaperone